MRFGWKAPFGSFGSGGGARRPASPSDIIWWAKNGVLTGTTNDVNDIAQEPQLDAAEYVGNNCLEFDATSEDHAFVDSNCGVTGYPFTLRARIAYTTGSSVNAVVSLIDKAFNNKQYMIGVSGGKIILTHRNGPQYSIISPLSYNNGNAYCVEGRFLGDTQFELWVGDTWDALSKVAEDTTNTTAFFPVDRAGIGANRDGSPGQFYTGVVGECGVYDGSTLSAMWPCAEGDTTGLSDVEDVYDTSGNINHMTLLSGTFIQRDDYEPHNVDKGFSLYDYAPVTLTDYYTIAVLPDAHYDTGDVLNDEKAVFDWIATNEVAEDIKAVICVGDLINGSQTVINEVAMRAKWDFATQVTEPITTAEIPFIIAAGNHDYLGGENAINAGTRINFIADYYNNTGDSWYSGAYDVSDPMVNYYTEFSWESSDYIIISVEMHPRTEVVAWVENIVLANTSKNIIIIEHSYIDEDGGIEPEAQELYDDVVSKYSNVKFVSFGHNHTPYQRETFMNEGRSIVNQVQPYVPPWETEISIQLLKVYYNEGVVTQETYFPLSDVTLPDLDTLHWETL